MNRLIFVNLPVADLNRSRSFYSALGYSFNEHFSNEEGACLVISETIHAMLLTPKKFGEFTPKAISNAKTSTEVLIALSCDSRAEVDELSDKALAAGGTAVREPKDHGFMYERAWQDPDGHIWEMFWMDPAAVPG